MKVCVPFDLNNSGGPSVFANKLIRGLEDRGVKITTDLTDSYHVALVIIEARLSDLLYAKKKGRTIIQRLDGVYYYATGGPLYQIKNARMKIIHNKLADHVVYQSQHSKEQVSKYLGEKKKENYSRIYNGVPVDRYKPNYKKSKVNLLTATSTFRREDEIIPVIRAFSMFQDSVPEASLRICGKMNANIRRLIPNTDDIDYIGEVPHSNMPNIFSGSDIFVYSKINPPCPNIILEAMASGLPIACYSTGSMPELVGKKAGICATYNGEHWRRFENGDPAKLADAIEEIINNYKYYSNGARKRAVNKFSQEKMVNQYYKLFDNIG